MSNRKIRGRTVASAAVISAAVGVAGFAFTASNTVPASRAGDGTGGVSGYTASNIRYTLDATDPTLADEVQFNVDTAPVAGSTMKVQLYAGGPWYACTNTATLVECDTTVGTQATVLEIEDLRVVIAQ